MSLSSLHSFRDWKKDTQEILPEEEPFLQELDEAGKSVKLARGIGDGNWDGVVANYYAIRGQLVPLLTQRPALPKDSTSSWKVPGLSQQEMFAWLGVKPKQDIGRGEAALYYWYNFTKQNAELKKYTVGDLFNWCEALEDKYPKELSKFLADQKVNKSSLRSSTNVPSKKKMDMYLKFLGSKEMVQLGQRLTSQGKSLFMNKPYCTEAKGTSDGPDMIVGGVPVEVKSYKSMTAQVTVGGIKDEGNFKPISLLTSLYGFYNLFHAFGSEKNVKPLNIRSIHAYDFPKALKAFHDVDEVLESIGKDAMKFEVFKSLKKHMDDLRSDMEEYGNSSYIKSQNLKSKIKKLDDDSTREDVARVIAKAIVLWKLGRKPGGGGFFFNSDPQGQIIWHIVEFDSITDEWEDIKHVTLDNNKLMVNFEKLTIE